MSQPGEYLNDLTIDDYAKDAFEQPVGGIFSGVGTKHALATAADRQQAKADGKRVLPESFARARLVPVAAGKVLVRWCKSAAMSQFEWAAGGLWWSSDNVADRIVQATVQKHGARGDSGLVAREVSAVRHDWSDLGGVVVVRTKWPIKVMVGFGRPVVTALPGSGLPALLGEGRDLQFMMKTTVDGVFRGSEFLQQLYLGSSVAFTEWWTTSNLVGLRRSATIQAARAGLITGSVYPRGIVRTS
jgi:hypothetical protein